MTTLKQHVLRPVSPFNLTLALATTTLLLAGCGDGNSSSDAGDDHDHEHEEIGTSGRLATFDITTSELKILEVEDGSLLETFPLSGAAPRLGHSADHRYAVIIQRDDDLVSFLDSGLYVEDHGDHMHEYAEPPTLLSLTLNDHRPTHYSLGEERNNAPDCTARPPTTTWLALAAVTACCDRSARRQLPRQQAGQPGFSGGRQPYRYAGGSSRRLGTGGRSRRPVLCD